MDDGVRERHGVKPHSHEEGYVMVAETDTAINLRAHNGLQGASRDLTPAEARYIASKLRRAARRVEERGNG